ncbi:MAG: hypothetical protein RJB58_296 [Pseudomonadota bacterium]|jgi:hypothetical protein
MRKLILGLGLLAVSRLLARRQPGGLARFTSLPSLAAMMAGVAASQMLNRPPANTAPSPKNGAQAHDATGGNNRNQSFWRRFSLQPNHGE